MLLKKYCLFLLLQCGTLSTIEGMQYFRNLFKPTSAQVNQPTVKKSLTMLKDSLSVLQEQLVNLHGKLTALHDSIVESEVVPTEQLPRKKIKDVAKSIGNFSIYMGVDQSDIYGNACQAFLSKQMLAQLNPTQEWLDDHVTTLCFPLSEQDLEERVVITTNVSNAVPVTSGFPGFNNNLASRVFGNATCFVSKSKLQQLASSSRLFGQEKYLLLYRLFGNQFYANIQEQEKRSMRQIAGESISDFKTRVQRQSQFLQEAEFAAATEMPLNVYATKICHAQEVLFFVEQQVEHEFALNKIRSGDLDNEMPVVLLSIPGLNFAYGFRDAASRNAVLADDGAQAKLLLCDMWRAVLKAAVGMQVEVLVIPPIGLGAFLPGSWSNQQKASVAGYYFAALSMVLNEYQEQNKLTYLRHIFYHPLFYKDELRDSCSQHIDSGLLNVFERDVKFFAIELAKAGYRAALVNPSDSDVIWGKYDVGEYYKDGHYVGEEDLAATSTAALGSIGITKELHNPYGF